MAFSVPSPLTARSGIKHHKLEMKFLQGIIFTVLEVQILARLQATDFTFPVGILCCESTSAAPENPSLRHMPSHRGSIVLALCLAVVWCKDTNYAHSKVLFRQVVWGKIDFLRSEFSN